MPVSFISVLKELKALCQTAIPGNAKMLTANNPFEHNMQTVPKCLFPSVFYDTLLKLFLQNLLKRYKGTKIQRYIYYALRCFPVCIFWKISFPSCLQSMFPLSNRF